MNQGFQLDIDEESSVPKYKQIVNSIIDRIVAGNIKLGQKIPSINEISFEYYLSRDTVEKAYSELKELNYITSVRGKGFYVTQNEPRTKIRVLLILNKLSAYKKIIYHAFTAALRDKAIVDLQIHHLDPVYFRSIVKANKSRYNYFVIMPHFRSFSKETIETLQEIPDNKLILLDNLVEGLEGNFGAVYQDFKMDIYHALCAAKDALEKYRSIILAFPQQTLHPYPTRIMEGFRKFCTSFHFDFKIIEEISIDHKPEKGEAYVVIEETDLANLLHAARLKKLNIGEELGVISYNETPLKRVLEKGVTVISTDHETMGKVAAEMILNRQMIRFKCPFNLIKRNTL